MKASSAKIQWVENIAEKPLLIKCAVCGMEYDPVENPSCGTCPLHRGCSMTCCPQCGSSNINVHQSRLVNFTKRLFSGGKRVSS